MLNEPSAIKVGCKRSLIPGIICQYASMGVSGVTVNVALGVLVAMGCWKSLVTCGGLLSSIDSALSGRLSNCCDSAIAATCTYEFAGVALATKFAAFFQLDVFIVNGDTFNKNKVTNIQ